MYYDKVNILSVLGGKMKRLLTVKKKTAILLLLCLLLVAMVYVFAVYLLDFYKADVERIEKFTPAVEIEEYELKRGVLAFEPKNARSALIFYPGGKVEHIAYIPLMRACAERGILCILVKMPLNLAFFDINAADGICENYPEIENWYIGGHSLGGAMAASYLDRNTEWFDGLVLLGAYSTADFSDEEIKVLSVYGSLDGVMNREKYEENRGNLPETFEEHVIEGGCHAYFGMYGAQDGDGMPTISNREQILSTAQIIYEFTRE